MNKFRVLKFSIWSVSAVSLVLGLVFAIDQQLTPTSRLLATILVQAGGAFFFALSVGWIIDKLRDKEGYSVLWLFSQEFRKAGMLDFYSNRDSQAVSALEEAFRRHKGGELLMAGASLRLFLAPGLHFYTPIKQMLEKRERKPFIVKAISCHPFLNKELPIRSFVEEFDQSGDFKKKTPFDWSKQIDFSFDQFHKDFFTLHGIDGSKEHARVTHDLASTRQGVMELGKAAVRSRKLIIRPRVDACKWKCHSWLAWQSGRPTNGADALEGAKPTSAGAFELHRVLMPVQPCSDPNLSSPQSSANDWHLHPSSTRGWTFPGRSCTVARYEKRRTSHPCRKGSNAIRCLASGDGRESLPALGRGGGGGSGVGRDPIGLSGVRTGASDRPEGREGDPRTPCQPSDIAARAAADPAPRSRETFDLGPFPRLEGGS